MLSKSKSCKNKNLGRANHSISSLEMMKRDAEGLKGVMIEKAMAEDYREAERIKLKREGLLNHIAALDSK